jgi:hypothetical protein
MPRRQRQALRGRLSAARSLRLEPLEERRLLAFAPVASYDVGLDPQAVVTADFNNDSLLDLAVTNYSDNTVSVLLGNADGTFQAAISSPTNIGLAGLGPRSLAVGDFDTDGNVDDLATLNNSDVSVLLGNGNGSLLLQGTVGLPAYPSSVGNVDQSPRSVAVGDVTGDGKLDLTVTGSTYYQTTHGPYYYPGYYGGSYGPYYTTHGHNNGHVNVLVGTGGGSFTQPAAEDVQLLPGAYPISAVLENLDGDPALDLAVADYYGGSVQLLSGNNDGTFDAPAGFSTGWNPVTVQSGDVNGDGIRDLITANYYSASVLLGNGSGGFDAPKTTSLDSYPYSLAVGDINDDGKLDLVTSSNHYYYGYTGRVNVLLGHGNGSFATAISHVLDEGTFAVGVAVGDLDGDDLLDVAVANSIAGAGQVTVLINAGDFALPTTFSIGDVTVTEGNAGTVAAVFTVTRSGNLGSAVSVNYGTANGGALAPSDYLADAGTVTFAANQTTKTITILVNGDVTDEFDQSFYVNLSPSSGVVFADGQGMGTILDNDDPPKISITSKVSGKEGNNNTRTTLTFIVTLSAPSEKEVRVSFATANGTATTADNDYIANSGTLVFAPLQTSKTIGVVIKGDKRKEPTETFSVNLSGATNATILLGQGIGEIIGDDTPPGKGKP